MTKIGHCFAKRSSAVGMLPFGLSKLSCCGFPRSVRQASDAADGG
jgi:hypothetical protein